jgi:hypothetical protein
MIGVPVRDQDVIGGDLFDIDVFGQVVPRDEGVEQKLFAGDPGSETSVSVVCNFHAPSLK